MLLVQLIHASGKIHKWDNTTAVPQRMGWYFSTQKWGKMLETEEIK